MNGIILVNKDKDMTSRDVVNKLCHIFNIKKIGHTGTLDPIATGLLICPIGKYTKLVDDLTSKDKVYIAEITLGISTDTGDITGNTLKKSKAITITREDIVNTLNSFKKTYLQTVPKYSAVKINGKKLYEYARENIFVDLPKREVTIYDIDLISFKDNKITFKTKVSKGTYIRSLIEDICNILNVLGTMSNLKRVEQGKFNINESYTLNDIEKGNFKLLTSKDIFDYPVIEIDEEVYYKVSNGVKLNNTFNIKDKVIFTYQNKEVAIYKLDENTLVHDISLM